MYYKDILNLKSIVLLLIFLFPSVVATIQHGGTAIYLLLMLAGLLYGWKAFQYLSSDEKKVVWGVMFFFSILLISLVNTIDYSMAGRKFERYLRVLGIIPIYLLLVRLNVQTYKSLLYGAVTSGFVLIVFGFYEMSILHKPSMEGAYYTILYGYISLLNLFLIVSALLVEKDMSVLKKGFFLISSISLLICVIYAESRASWLAAVFISVFFIFVVALSKKIKISLRTFVAFITVMLLVVGLNAERIEKRINYGVQDVITYESEQIAKTSLGIRLSLWKDSLTLFFNSPALGTGVGDFDYERDLLIAQGKTPATPSFGHAHNQFFDSLATTGVIGIAGLLLGVFIIPFWYFFKVFNSTYDKNEKYFSLVGMVVLIGFIFFGFGEVWLARNPTANVYAFFIAIALAGITNSRRKPHDKN